MVTEQALILAAKVYYSMTGNIILTYYLEQRYWI